MSTVGITLAELLADNEASTAKWEAWFAENPAALDAPCDIYNSKTVGGLVRHIFAVETRHSQRLMGEPATPYEAIPSGSGDVLFTLHSEAIHRLHKFLEQSTPAALDEVIELQTVSAGTLHASRRKLFVHVMLHSMRHWAQMATHLRAQGYTTGWAKDFLMSDAMR